MAVRRLRRTRTRRLVQLVKPRVTAIITKKGWEDILRKSKGKTLVVMFRGVSSSTWARPAALVPPAWAPPSPQVLARARRRN